MRKLAAALAIALALSAPASLAHAGVYTDDLTKCLVKHTAPVDQEVFMVWIFAAISAHPAAERYGKMSEAERESFIKRAAELMQRLMTVDCRSETVVAIKYEGGGAIQNSFSVLGQVAMRDLFTDPKVAAGMQRLASYVDSAKFEELGREAGEISAAPAKAK